MRSGMASSGVLRGDDAMQSEVRKSARGAGLCRRGRLTCSLVTAVYSLPQFPSCC
jgi:hypothetical protein